MIVWLKAGDFGLRDSSCHYVGTGHRSSCGTSFGEGCGDCVLGLLGLLRGFRIIASGRLLWFDDRRQKSAAQTGIT